MCGNQSWLDAHMLAKYVAFVKIIQQEAFRNKHIF